MTINDVLPLVLYILGVILLITLIILTIKLIITMNKIDKVVDNITVKVKSLDGLFRVVDTVTNSVTLISDKFIDSIALLIDKIFKRKGETEENE